MRLAIVAASTYEQNGQVAPIPNAVLDVELIGSRLAEADAGFVVHAFAAQRGFAEGVADLVAQLGARPRELVLYFWGYALNSEERGPTLLLDGQKLTSFTLARLRRWLTEVADASLVIVDATLADGSSGAPLSVVRAMGSALSGGDSTVTSLIAVRPGAVRAAPGPPPFTGLVQMILDAQTGSTRALVPEALFRAMQAEEVLFADIPAAGCFLGSREFVLVPGAQPVSAPPPRPRAPSQEELDEVTAPRLHLLDLEPKARSKRERRPPPPPPPILRHGVRPSVASESDLAPASSAAEHCRHLFTDFERAGDRDGAYRAALCLEALGEANINESLLATTHRPVGLQGVRQPLSYADWHERLNAGCAELQVTALLRALGPALAQIGHRHARRLRRELTLPGEARHDPEQSTTTLAKTLHWASRLLSVPAPEFFVLPQVSGALALAPGPERPLLICERALGSGFSLSELVCLWARELSFARSEQAALCYFLDPSELAELLLAALAFAGVTSLRSLSAGAKLLASGLKREVRGAAHSALCEVARTFPVDEVHVRARSFIRSAELVAGRVALVACGDLELTLQLEHRFPRPGLTRTDERRADLFQFALGHELGQIRSGLGIAVK